MVGSVGPGTAQHATVDRAPVHPGRLGRTDFEQPEFFFAARISTAPSSYPGATTTSVNTSAIWPARATLTGRLVAITRRRPRPGHTRGPLVGLAMSAPTATPTVGVLDDRHRRFGEVVRGTSGASASTLVVVGHLLAVQLPGRGQTTRAGLVEGQGGRLVRVLP